MGENLKVVSSPILLGVSLAIIILMLMNKKQLTAWLLGKGEIVKSSYIIYL
jgi:hypothetical protein